MVVDFMRGRIFASLGGGLNVVAVEDVAKAHVQALQRGRPRERYLVGGENLQLDQLWELLAQICGRRAPTAHIPYGLALALGWADELRCRLFGGAAGGLDAPLVPLEGVRMARHTMFISDQKARTELGHEASPVQGALERAAKWYYDHGYAT
jgi:dihydroflavonol-4-reductase